MATKRTKRAKTPALKEALSELKKFTRQVNVLEKRRSENSLAVSQVDVNRIEKKRKEAFRKVRSLQK
jgi:hypothetical protein